MSSKKERTTNSTRQLTLDSLPMSSLKLMTRLFFLLFNDDSANYSVRSLLFFNEERENDEECQAKRKENREEQEETLIRLLCNVSSMS